MNTQEPGNVFFNFQITPNVYKYPYNNNNLL